MAAPSYTRTLDTLAAIALDERTRDIHSTITELGEKFLRLLNAHGRVFVVNDAEGTRHPLTYVGSEDPTYNFADDLGGGSYNYEEVARDPMTQTQWTHGVGSININYPQKHPGGDLVGYVDMRVDTTLEDVYNLEERLMLDGNFRTSGTMQGETHVDPFYGDTNAPTAGKPTSLMNIMNGGTEQSGVALALDQSADMWSGVKVDDVGTNYQPYKAAVTDVGLATGFFNDLQTAYTKSYYTEREKTTHVLTSNTVFNKTLDLMRADGALPDPVKANLGLEGTFNFGGMVIDWSRYLKKNILWDAAAGAVAHAPILGINVNSLRMNVTKRGGAMPHDPVGMFEQVGSGMTVVQTKPVIFQRIAWKRNLSIDRGRRSFFQLYGSTISA